MIASAGFQRIAFMSINIVVMFCVYVLLLHAHAKRIFGAERVDGMKAILAHVDGVVKTSPQYTWEIWCYHTSKTEGQTRELLHDADLPCEKDRLHRR